MRNLPLGRSVLCNSSAKSSEFGACTNHDPSLGPMICIPSGFPNEFMNIYAEAPEISAWAEKGGKFNIRLLCFSDSDRSSGSPLTAAWSTSWSGCLV